jgi:hypothetical protein
MASVGKHTLTYETPQKEPKGAQIREHTRHYAGTSHANPHKDIREMRGEIVKNDHAKAHQLTVKGQKG